MIKNKHNVKGAEMEERKNISGSNYFGESPAQNNKTENTQSTKTFQPVYDEFMYEPIGFETETDVPLTEEPRKPKRKKASVSEILTIVLFVMLVSIAGILSVWGITSDLMNSDSVIKELKTKQNVVLYQNTKPQGANELENFIDEN